MNTPKYILPIIVISQFCCTSLWFAGNGVMTDLVNHFGLKGAVLGHLTSSVQFGFIVGTLVFAIFTIADRFSPSKVFFFCSLLGAVFNLGMIWEHNSLWSILIFRFFTGFFLAGIYPVGMKIAADYFDKGLGKSLGYLVGALVIGTAFPHFLREMTYYFPWKSVVIATSFLAFLGGLAMLLMVPNGPFRKNSLHMNIASFFHVFRNRQFRSVSFGYFGHMWELYAFWTFVPIMLKSYNAIHPTTTFNIPLLSFFIIAIGGIACVASGYLSQTIGTKRTAFISLFLSCLCCLVSPIMFTQESAIVFITFLLCWGMFVIADSPLFSTMVAQNSPSDTKGTALTIVNCIGFAITIISIQLISLMKTLTNSNAIYMILALGPIVGLLALLNKKQQYK